MKTLKSLQSEKTKKRLLLQNPTSI